MQFSEQNKRELTEQSIATGLETHIIGKNIIVKETTTSTQTDAHELVKLGAPDGTVIIAREQTAGRGRGNRKWQSLKDKTIAMSIILYPDILPHIAPQMTLMAATVISETLEKVINVRPEIKWPNDVLFNGKKFVGILTEMSAENKDIDYIVVGIGINVNNQLEDLPQNTNYPTTSLALETNQIWDIASLIQQILRHFEQAYLTFLQEGFQPFKEVWESYMYKKGEKILINDFKNKWVGTLIGINDDGALLVEKDQELKKIYSAEIEWYNDN